MERPKVTPTTSGSKIRIEVEDDGSYSQVSEVSTKLSIILIGIAVIIKNTLS